MNVIVPYTNEGTMAHEAMLLNLAIHGVRPRMHPTPDDTSYAELFNDLWTRRETFIINEHDVLAPPGAIRDLWDCPLFWCGYNETLQCTKFIPVGKCPVPMDTPWHQVDRQVWANMRGFHEHEGTVINLHPGAIPV